MRDLALGLVGALVLFAAPTPARGQASSRVSFDATIGPGVVRTSGPYRDLSNDITLDAMLGVRVREFSHGAVFAGMNVGVHSGWGGTDLDCIPAPGYACAPRLPTFEMVGAVVGWQDTRAIIRAATGATYVQADWDGWSVAWQSRVDLRLPMTRHVSPVMSLRATVVPNYPNGDSFRLFAFGFGLRIH
jgi:hypothetical protein